MSGAGATVSSVFGRSGAVVAVANDYNADQIDDAATTNKFATAGQLAKVDHLTVTQAVDLDAMETTVGHLTVTQAVDLDAIETRVNALDQAIILQGVWDASAGTFPGAGAAQAGDSWIVSVAGTVNGVPFAVDDRIIAITDNASTTVFASNWHKADYSDLVQSVAGLTGAISASGLRTAINVQDGATADQSDTEIETAYNNRVSIVTQVDAEAGTDTTVRRWTPQRVGQAIAALAEPIDADILKADVGDTLTAGYLSDSFAGGTITTGTYTPAPATGQENFQHIVNGGAFTLDPPASPCTVILEITNNASAGAITTTGFTSVDGDAFTTTNNDAFICYITRTNGNSYLSVKAL